VLALFPDHTSSLPLPELFRMVGEILHVVRQLDFMVALGTHPSMSAGSINRLVGITAEELSTTFQPNGLLNHSWEDPSVLASLGVMDQDEIKQIAGSSWHISQPDKIEIRINKCVLEYNHILVLGPIFPCELVSLASLAKYLFSGISGPDMINATHWLGVLAIVVGTIGIKDTPVRAIIHGDASRLPTPITLAALVVTGHGLTGIFVGELFEAWSLEADFSARRNITWCEHPFQRVLSCAPAMFDELRTAAKTMYKLEPAGGEMIIYAIPLNVVSHVHGRYIHVVRYHTLPYFLNDWERFKHVPLGVQACPTDR